MMDNGLSEKLLTHFKTCMSCRVSTAVHMGYGNALIHQAIKAYNTPHEVGDNGDRQEIR